MWQIFSRAIRAGSRGPAGSCHPAPAEEVHTTPRIARRDRLGQPVECIDIRDAIPRETVLARFDDRQLEVLQKLGAELCSAGAVAAEVPWAVLDDYRADR